MPPPHILTQPWNHTSSTIRSTITSTKSSKNLNVLTIFTCIGLSYSSCPLNIAIVSLRIIVQALGPQSLKALKCSLMHSTETQSESHTSPCHFLSHHSQISKNPSAFSKTKKLWNPNNWIFKEWLFKNKTGVKNTFLVKIKFIRRSLKMWLQTSPHV